MVVFPQNRSQLPVCLVVVVLKPPEEHCLEVPPVALNTVELLLLAAVLLPQNAVHW